MVTRCLRCLEPVHTASWGGYIHNRTSRHTVYRRHSVTGTRYVSRYASGSPSLDVHDLLCGHLVYDDATSEQDTWMPGPLTRLGPPLTYEGPAWPTDVHFV